jgi:ribulose-phosphate 3-epimerase
MKPSLISASILSADFGHLADQIHLAEEAGVDWIHIDVMDGHFVPNITMGPFIVGTCKRLTGLPLDVHLMVEKPENIVESFIKNGADIVTIHVEKNPNVHSTLQQIRTLGAKPGIALNPGTPASAIETLLPFIDMVLVMTVNPGFSGQTFIPQMIEKIAAIASMAQASNPALNIQVDGGITAQTLPGCLDAGASVFVAATAIFKHPGGIHAGTEELRRSMVK